MSEYEIRLGAGPWVEISREAWLALERSAGFIAQHPGKPATASWGATLAVQGRRWKYKDVEEAALRDPIVRAAIAEAKTGDRAALRSRPAPGNLSNLEEI